MYTRISRGGAASSEAEQGLESCHRLLSPIIAKDKFIEVHLELIPAYTMMRSDQPLLQVANRAVSQRHHRFGAVAHIRSPRLNACHVLEPSVLQAAEAREAVSVYRGTRSHILLQEAGQRCAFEIGDHRHAAATGGTPAFLHRHEYQRRFPTPELTAALQTCLRTPNPGLVYFYFSPQWFAVRLTMARRNLWSIIHAVSYRRSPS